MRTYVLYGALALAGCSSPEAAFPKLADLKPPPPPATTSIQRQSLFAEIARAGETIERAPRRVRLDTLAVRVHNLASDERLAEASTSALLIVLAGLLPVVALTRAMQKR